nr:cytochrome P450 monooxygenase CYP4C131 [Lasioderma serricorne]
MDLITAVLTLLLIALPTLIWIKSDPKKRKIEQYVNQLPGPKRIPILGTSLQILKTPREGRFSFFQKRCSRYKPLFRSWLGDNPLVHIMKPEHIEIVLRSSEHLSKGDSYRFIQPWLGDGLLTSTGQKWHRNRKLITPTFHFKILEHFQEVFDEKSRVLVHKLAHRATDGRFFDVYPLITRCALDIICETAMGVQMNAMDEEGSGKQSDYVDAVYGVSELALKRRDRPWLQSDFSFKLSPTGKEFEKYLSVLHGFTNKVIQERKDQLRKKKALKEEMNGKASTSAEEVFGRKERLAFLDLLIEASDSGRLLSDTEIREEVDTFMFEGHDTTTAGICWTLFLLGNHVDVQDKVAQELHDIFQDDVDRPITTKDLGEMKYLERVVKESLRLYPSVPFIARKLTKDIECDGLIIPESCSVAIHIYNVHRDPNHFPEPNRFDPDRFLPENTRNRHPYAYIPFSAGPRNCIGQKFALNEEKTVLANFLRNYEIKSKQTAEEITLISELILRPLGGLQVALAPRKL